MCVLKKSYTKKCFIAKKSTTGCLLKCCSQRNRNIFCICHLQFYGDLYVANTWGNVNSRAFDVIFQIFNIKRSPFPSSVKINLLFVGFFFISEERPLHKNLFSFFPFSLFNGRVTFQFYCFYSPEPMHTE